MPEDEVRRNLLDIRRINRLFGSRTLVLEVIKNQVSRHGLTRFTVLDLASGSCDLPLAILHWAERQGLEARVFALEYWHRYLKIFQKELSAQARLYPIAADVFSAPVADHAFDFVLCNHFFHHLPEERAIELLRAMARWARIAIIVNDLERQAIPYYFFRLFHSLFTSSSMSRVDGLASFRQAFRKEELERIARQANLEDVRVERRWPFRLLLVAELSPTPKPS